MPHNQKKIILSNFQKGFLSMIARLVKKNARLEIKQYLITNKISINQSSVISKAFSKRLMAAILFIVSTVLFIASNTWGNAWVSIPFFTFLIYIPICMIIDWMIIPRGRETAYFKKGEIIPQYAREFKKFSQIHIQN